MFLVDTSVWIDYLRQNPTEPVVWLREILEFGYPFGITPQIYQEVLQGADSPQSFERLASYLGSQTFYLPGDPVEGAIEAARLYFLSRRKGLTIRSTADCSIAQIAIEHGLLLLHGDRDFDHLQRVAPELRIYRGGLTPRRQPDLIQEPRAPYGETE